MKRTIMLALCLAGILSCTQKRPAIIERPTFDVWNSTTLEIDKIEMSDTATIFHIDAYSHPKTRIKIDKGAYIRKSGSDEKLLIISSEGINLDGETDVPESGSVSFKLFFPPLKPGIIKIDFIDNNFKIWGINLLSDAKIKFDPIPQDVVKTSTEPLPTPTYSTQPAQVSGRMLGYVHGMEPGSVTIITQNGLHFKKSETALPIAEDGSFSSEITPGFASIYNSSLGPLFLIPGEEAKIYVDLKKRSRYQSRYRTDKEPGDSIYTYVSGRFTCAELENINQVLDYFNGTIRSLPDYQKLKQDIVNMNPEEFKQYMLGIMDKRLDEIKQKNYHANMQMLMEYATIIDVCFFMIPYEVQIFVAKRDVNNLSITTAEERDKLMASIEKPDIEYYSFLKKLNDNMSYLPSFLWIANYISGYSFFNPDRKNKPVKEQFAYFKAKMAPILGTDKGMLFDVIQAQYYGVQLSNMKPFTDVEKQEIRDAFSDKPVYAEVLIAESDRMEALINASKGIMNDPPDVPQEQMLDAILAKYNGKVVVADVWGTWCAPCMVAMKSIQPLKDEMKEKDVVFLYLADETSPLDAWKQTYPTISGEHYRLKQAQMNFWKISAYPTYMIFDRQGKQLARYVDFPGVDVIKRDIEKGL